jgi:hypothetical protein
MIMNVKAQLTVASKRHLSLVNRQLSLECRCLQMTTDYIN